MKFEEGMYARTKKGKIYKFKSNNSMARVPYMINCSYNIIDLIQVGDYVNGYPVVDFDVTYFNGIDRREEPKRIGVIVEKNMGFSKTYFKNEDIKTILTKEQFEIMAYNVLK